MMTWLLMLFGCLQALDLRNTDLVESASEEESSNGGGRKKRKH